MANINLSTSQASAVAGKRHLSGTGNLIGGAILAIILIIIAALYFWKGSLDGKVAAAEADYNAKYAKLTEGRNKDVIDFQSRIFSLNVLARKNNAITDALQNVEKYIVSGAYLASYEFNKDAKTIKLNCRAENYDVVAKQVASFKSFENFTSVDLSGAKTNDKGGVDFTIELAIK